MENNVVRLPDAYDKDSDSNISKLLQLAYTLASDYEGDLNSINASRDIESTYGKTLDNYGAMVGVARNGIADEQYITRILNKIAADNVGSDCNGVIKAIALMMRADENNVSLTEGDMVVSVFGLTIAQLTESGYSASGIRQMIENLLPIGVALEDVVYNGTFEFSDSYQYDNVSGFGNEEQTIGGTLGEIT